MNGSPWVLFLPPDPTARTLILGKPTRRLRQSLQGRRLSTAVEDGPFAAVVRFGDGPPAGSNVVAKAVRALSDDGCLLWFSRTGPLSEERARALLSRQAEKVKLSTYLPGRGVLVSPTAHWTVPVARTGRVALLRTALETMLSRSMRARTTLTVVRPASGSASWLDGALAHGELARVTSDDPLCVARIDATNTGIAVVQLGSDPVPRWALKVGLEDSGARRLQSEAAELVALSGRSDLSHQLSSTVPRVRDHGRLGDHAFVVESWLPGRAAARLMLLPRQAACEDALDLAADWITNLHRTTLGRPMEPGRAASLARRVLSTVSGWLGEPETELAEQVAEYLEPRLDALKPPMVQGHGDYWLANILIDSERSRVTGVVDWDRAHPHAAPLGDVLHLLCFRRWFPERWDPGGRLASLMTGRASQRDRHRIGLYVRALDLPLPVVGPLALLYWLNLLDDRQTVFEEDRRMYSRLYRSVRAVLRRGTATTLDGLGENLIRPD